VPDGVPIGGHWLGKHILTATDNRCSNRRTAGPCQGYNEDQQDKLVVRQLPAGKDVSTEAEEYPLLDAVTRK
jgi:hypothetical protein